jgi:NADH-quinone oxidoreductase subunit C
MSKMTNEQLKETVISIVPNAEFAENKQYLIVIVPNDKLYHLAKTIKESSDTSFDFLFSLSGMDWGDNLGVIYHLESTKHRHCIVLKTKTAGRENPEVDSVCDIWKTADFLEREAFDFFGIVFKNHPDLRRIFLDDNWKGYPLRKDYVDEVNIVER